MHILHHEVRLGEVGLEENMDCMPHHYVICITRSMKGKQMTPFKGPCPNACFMIAPFASDDCNGKAHTRKTLCVQCILYFATAFVLHFFRVPN